jgi:hypothetical protein
MSPLSPVREWAISLSFIGLNQIPEGEDPQITQGNNRNAQKNLTQWRTASGHEEKGQPRMDTNERELKLMQATPGAWRGTALHVRISIAWQARGYPTMSPRAVTTLGIPYSRLFVSIRG